MPFSLWTTIKIYVYLLIVCMENIKQLNVTDQLQEAEVAVVKGINSVVHHMLKVNVVYA